MALRWQRIRVELVRGRGVDLDPAPGRIMLVPPEATLEDFGLGVDLAFGRWDVTQGRSFRSVPRGRHEARRLTAVPLGRPVRDAFARNDVFEYVLGDDDWVHVCLVEEFVARKATQGLAPIPVPTFGWGSIPDQYGRAQQLDEPWSVLEPRVHVLDTESFAADATDEADEADEADASDEADEADEIGDAAETADSDEPADADDVAGAKVVSLAAERAARSEAAAALEHPSRGTAVPKGERRSRAIEEPLDLVGVRAAVAAQDATLLLAAIDGRDLSAALQQVGDGLTRLYRLHGNGAPVQAQLARSLGDVEALLVQRGWEGDDILAEEIGALLNGSERRGRTLQVSIDDLADVMSSGGDEPGGYLHLDTGEVVHAFLRHEELAEVQDTIDDSGEIDLEADDLWIYIDHDDSGWSDMAAFAEAAPRQYSGILSVAIKGKGAFARFRRTVDELDLWTDWQVFSDDRRWGRARALLRSQGIRPV